MTIAVAAPPDRLECRYCMGSPVDHPACTRCGHVVAHEYASLLIPCTGCNAAISWSRDGWLDTTGRDYHPTEAGISLHAPDPSFLP